MKQFAISEEQINKIVTEISEAPAKYSFNSITILGSLQPIIIQDKVEEKKVGKEETKA